MKTKLNTGVNIQVNCVWEGDCQQHMHKNDWHLLDTPLGSDWLCSFGAAHSCKSNHSLWMDPQTVDSFNASIVIIRQYTICILFWNGPFVCQSWKQRMCVYLKVPNYTVCHQFSHRGPTTLYSICSAPNSSVVLNFSCLKVTQVSSTESRLFLYLHL